MNYIIIGSGAAGIQAARELRQRDPKGTIHVFSGDMGAYSRCMLHQYVSGERNPARLRFVDPDFFERWDIRHHPECPVKAVCPREKTVATEKGVYPYDKLLVASGAVSRIPPTPGFAEAPNVFGFRDLRDAEAILLACQSGRRAFVVGTGLSGMDAAYGLIRRGLDVTVNGRSPRIIPRQSDETVSGLYETRFRQAGARLLLGQSVVRTVQGEGGRITGLIMADGEEIPCDFVVAAAGVTPSAAFLNGSGIATGKGIAVNEYLETSVPDIFAAGDVTGLSGTWASAALQGRTAARNMLGLRERYKNETLAKNTMNFFGLPAMALGDVSAPIGSGEEIVWKDGGEYCRIVRREGTIVSVQLAGNLDHGGIWEYLIRRGMGGDWSADKLRHASQSGFYGFSSDAGKKRIQSVWLEKHIV